MCWGPLRQFVNLFWSDTPTLSECCGKVSCQRCPTTEPLERSIFWFIVSSGLYTSQGWGKKLTFISNGIVHSREQSVAREQFNELVLVKMTNFQIMYRKVPSLHKFFILGEKSCLLVLRNKMEAFGIDTDIETLCHFCGTEVESLSYITVFLRKDYYKMYHQSTKLLIAGLKDMGFYAGIIIVLCQCWCGSGRHSIQALKPGFPDLAPNAQDQDSLG